MGFGLSVVGLALLLDGLELKVTVELVSANLGLKFIDL